MGARKSKIPSKTDFERLVTDGVVKIKLTAEQRQRHANAVKTQHRVDMGRFFRDAYPKAFDAAYKAFVKDYKKNFNYPDKNNSNPVLKNHGERKKRGRPPLPEDKRRSESIESCVTPLEFVKLQYAAHERGTNLSEFLRDAALRAAGSALFERKNPHDRVYGIQP